MNDYKELIKNLDRVIFREKTAIYGVGEINVRSMATECKQVIEQLVKERDAAVEDAIEGVRCKDCKYWDDIAIADERQSHECHFIDSNKYIKIECRKNFSTELPPNLHTVTPSFLRSGSIRFLSVLRLASSVNRADIGLCSAGFFL